jgi:hypothetical protein
MKRRLFPLVSQIGINYRDSSLSKNNGSFKVKAGDRMPYFQVDNRSIYDRMREPKFHLLVFSDTGFPDRGIDLKELIDVSNLNLTKEISEVFGSDKPFVLVVRPDNYIGLISNEVSIDGVRNYFRDNLDLQI